jgi:hypothetical protein
MSMTSVKSIATNMGLNVNDVRRIARSNGFQRYKDAHVEMYDTDDFNNFANETLKKRKLSKAHLAKLNAGRKKK